MKRDEDVWISRGTKASRPDELGPDQGSRVADRALQAGKTGEEEGGEQRANPDNPRAWSLSSSEGNGGFFYIHPPFPPRAPRSATQVPWDWNQQKSRRPNEWGPEKENFSIQR